MPKVVYSRNLERAGWNAAVVRDLVPAEVLVLKAQTGGDLVLGGADLGAEFARHDLIDEYRLYVHPVVIRPGRPMLRPSDAKVPLRPIETHTFATVSSCCGTSGTPLRLAGG
jgi:dihydrofolate reductase